MQERCSGAVLRRGGDEIYYLDEHPGFPKLRSALQETEFQISSDSSLKPPSLMLNLGELDITKRSALANALYTL